MRVAPCIGHTNLRSDGTGDSKTRWLASTLLTSDLTKRQLSDDLAVLANNLHKFAPNATSAAEPRSAPETHIIP